MSIKAASESEILKAAFGPTEECPPLETLARFAENATAISLESARHVESCAYCRTELHLLQTYEAGAAAQDSEKLQEVTRRLGRMQLPTAAPGVPAKARPVNARERWWSFGLPLRSMALGSAAMAGLLLAAAALVYLRQDDHPALVAGNAAAPTIFRGLGVAVLSPVGDLQSQPSEITWESVRGAATYQVRLLEVDQSEAWKAATAQNRIALPPDIRARIVPAKTLFCDVTAFDSAGNKIGSSGLTRFRVVQKPVQD